MGKKSRITQELANSFPDWTRVRNDDQSVGQSFLNAIGENLETISTELQRAYDNLFLSTANVGEIDLTYRFSLPPSFEFTEIHPNQLSSQPQFPTISGLVGDTWYGLTEIEGGVKEFWYDAIPDRISESTILSGVNHLLISDTTEEVVFSGLNDIFLENKLHLSVIGPSLFIESDNPDGFLRAKIRITGTTWKDTEDTEEINFIYSQLKRTNKVWKEVTKVEAIDFPEEADIQLTTHGFLLNEYPDPYSNISQFNHSRDFLSHFWSLEESDWTEDLILLKNKTYAATRAVDVLSNRVDKTEYREWELLDTSGNPVVAIDIAPIPYTQKAWAISASGLYLFDLEWDQPSLDIAKGRTNAPLAQIVASRDYVTRNEEVEIELRFIKPIKTVMRHRLAVTYPDGTTLGVLEDDSLVATTTKFWVENVKEDRLLRHPVIFEFEDLGDHILTLEVQYLGGDIEIDKRIIRVASKTALKEFDLYSLMDITASGIDIDHLQRLLILDTNSDVHVLNLHYDQVLVDYIGKELIFRENYDRIKILK